MNAPKFDAKLAARLAFSIVCAYALGWAVEQMIRRAIQEEIGSAFADEHSYVRSLRIGAVEDGKEPGTFTINTEIPLGKSPKDKKPKVAK